MTLSVCWLLVSIDVCEPVMVLWKNSFRTHWILKSGYGCLWMACELCSRVSRKVVSR
jgi:hypothetical protein